MSNLFSINEKYLNLLNQLEDIIETAEDDIEVVAAEEIKALEITEQEAKDKIEAYYYIIKQKEGEIDLLKDEQQRLKDKVETKNNLISRLKKNVDQALRLYGTKTPKGNYKLQTDKLSVWNVFNKPVVFKDDFYNVNYMRFKLKTNLSDTEKHEIERTLTYLGIKPEFIPEVDKVKLKEDLKNGKPIPGARIDEDAAYVRFK